MNEVSDLALLKEMVKTFKEISWNYIHKSKDLSFLSFFPFSTTDVTMLLTKTFVALLNISQK